METMKLSFSKKQNNKRKPRVKKTMNKKKKCWVESKYRKLQSYRQQW